MVSLMGSMTAKALIAKSDYGYITQTEMLDVTRRVVNAVDIPVLVDCDDGYGHPLIVRRTVELFEQAGAAGIIIEDLKPPLRCAALGGGSILSQEAGLQKMRAALDAKKDPDFVVATRTDVYGGTEEALSRACNYAEAGSDLVFVVALFEVDEIKRLGEICTAPLMIMQVDGSKIPMIPPAELYDMGYKIVLYNSTLTMASVKAIRDGCRILQDSLKDLSKTPSTLGGITIMEQEKLFGLEEDNELVKKYFS